MRSFFQSFNRWDKMSKVKSSKLRAIRHKLMPSQWEKLTKKSPDSPIIDCKNESDLNPLLCKHSQEDTFDDPPNSSDNDPCDCEECLYLDAFYTILESVNLM